LMICHWQMVTLVQVSLPPSQPDPPCRQGQSGTQCLVIPMAQITTILSI
jgi:hypothetical protein